MTRRLLACSLLVLAGLVVVARPGAAQAIGNPGDPTIVVYPVGAHPDDVNNVQWAVDNVASPGTVVMMSTDMSLNPLAFDFGSAATPAARGVLKLLRPDITLTGDGWDDVLDEPMTKILNGGGPFGLTPSVSGGQMVFAVRAPGVVIRELKVATAFAATGVYMASYDQPGSDHPVVVERTHINVTSYAVLVRYTAAFPVKIEGNRLEAAHPINASYIGFTLRPITTEYGLPYDEPVPPADASGNLVRYPFEITNNTLLKTPATTGDTLLVYGWSNYYNGPAGEDLTDLALGCRRFRENNTKPYRYQCAPADNGPVLISGNSITLDVDPATAVASGIEVAWGDAGLRHVVVAGNRLFGTSYAGIRQYAYADDTVILDNDLSGLLANHSMIVSSADTIVADNTLGPVLPRDMPLGLPTPAMLIASAHYYPGFSPAPRPTENSIIMRNDYRQTGVDGTAVILASRAELQYPTGAGGEVKNNVIFESGSFAPGTGGASNHVMELNVMINPETGLPYVHDNRIVGTPADGLGGIGAAVARVNAIRKDLSTRK